MTNSKVNFQQLSIFTIEKSPEIQSWLSQFSVRNRPVAKKLLCHLKFVSRDEFSSWLNRVVGELHDDKTHALYSVRKLKEVRIFWDESGEPAVRPGSSQGSEDLVYSLISNLVRSKKGHLLDHPSLPKLKEMRVRSYILIDDSIGSGDRVSSFIEKMLAHKTFLSWWNFGWVKIHIIAFARSSESKTKIISKIKGSNGWKRKVKKTSKIEFTSKVVYSAGQYEWRWGDDCSKIMDFCKKQTQIRENTRLGYGGVMSNIIFHHSVPNNIPGVLFVKRKQFSGLFPDRAIPDWLFELLSVPESNRNTHLSDDLPKLLLLVKNGIRSVPSLAIRLSVEPRYVKDLIDHAMTLNLLTPQVRLTSAARNQLIQSSRNSTLPMWNRTLYIPSSWCAGQATVQPLTGHQSADSAETSADGGVGQTSLEKSDARTAAPSFSVASLNPSVSRSRRDTDGSCGSKEW